MSRVVELLRSRSVPQFAVLALMSVGFAGCSADMSTRLSQNYSNPFASEPQATGSVPTPAVERRELPQYSRPQSQTPSQQQYQSQALPPPSVAAPHSYPVASKGVSGGGRGLSSYTPPAHPQLETTGTVAPRSVAAAHPPAAGGTTIIVGTSDTLDLLSKRYNVSTAAILQANGYKGPRALSPGQQLIIPRQTAAVAAPVAATAPAVAPPLSRPVAAASSVHIVNRGDTLMSIARRNHVPVAELARANNLDTSARLSLGMKLNVPGAKSAAAAPVMQPVAAAPVQPVAAVAAPATKMAAAAVPPQSARLAQATTNVTEEKPVAAEVSAVKPSEATGALPTFRWPVRGKVITSYGAKTNGKSNDGINLAVPEGTPVKAAEDGVVAYSGNELKGYGNLVLVRHSNGYVTAYAHASELMVKRGDTIKRGQIIAKSGQSGEVGSPQLHFEIRKGSSPVDPLQFLNGA
ncbi:MULTISPECIES: peptidoglycan DD-metalloendopeptidase family protein [Bradyrhizobium]|uniref:Murein DD-endopeptidase MepM and murein hydrolase activator NlpD, contain LysM domain n=2 Tax=Bradyrhizobium TaxID=374 RepID=A0ABY0QFK9_9BRAD|nr:MULTISPECIES: peptidoglycan DD-metalloendopeptidase family protein [Bradyrhizobium]SDK18560.1 Murein DD-endopeptidase MepM and murein hydrolase activator NlpD, contain LysM domain [Bradyrhizobium ottawaense]SEE48348.1 Murein DD-endopeptidase MepM and murein hydrolase activator NlpD, contain LysM domain [Bradyrhizobium lablabi]